MCSSSLIAPLNKKDRILFLDCLRGFAILGILIMNIMGAGQNDAFYRNMDLSQPTTGPNLWAWVIGNGLFDGAMRGIFSMLFGAGTILLLDRLEKNATAITPADINATTITPADIYYRRVLWLFLFGLFNAFFLLWWGDILYFYGLCGLVLFPFRKMTPKQLLVPIFIILAFGIYRESNVVIRNKEIISKGRQAQVRQDKHQQLTEQQTKDLTAFEGFQKENSSEAMMTKAKEDTKTFQTANLDGRRAIIWNAAAFFEGPFFYDNWFDIVVLFLIGMALYRSGFLTGQKSTTTYALVGFSCTIIALLMNYIEFAPMYVNKFDLVKITESSLPIRLHQLRRVLQVIGYTGLLRLCYSWSPIFCRAFNWLAPVGQMAFTNYLCQSIFMLVAFVIMDYYGKLQRYQLFGMAVGFYILQIVFSNIWLRFFRFGPFEWAWRSLTYWKRQPMKKQESTAIVLTS